MQSSLGLIETLGYAAAIEAADAGSKAANVTLRGYERGRAGLITVKFAGDVAAVRVAVTAGAAAARRVGTVVAAHVIARPVRDLELVSEGMKNQKQKAQPQVSPQEPMSADEKSVNSAVETEVTEEIISDVAGAEELPEEVTKEVKQEVTPEVIPAKDEAAEECANPENKPPEAAGQAGIQRKGKSKRKGKRK